MRLRDLNDQQREAFLDGVEDTVRQMAIADVEAQKPVGADNVAWTIGTSAKNCLIRMRQLRLLPEDFLFGDITVDYPRNIPQPIFRLQVKRLP